MCALRMQMSGRVEVRECASAVRNPREVTCIASGGTVQCESEARVKREHRAGNSARAQTVLSSYSSSQHPLSSSHAAANGTLITKRKRQTVS